MQKCTPRNLKCDFLKQPTAVNSFNEVEKRPHSEWGVQARAYCSFESRGGREVMRAQQIHAEINAMVECDWTHALSLIDADNAIRVYKPNQTFEVFEIRYVDDVDFQNTTLKFWCTATVT